MPRWRARTRLAGARLDGANLLEARNLTQIQLDDAMGDAMTELPPHLTRPGFWLEDELDPALEGIAETEAAEIRV